MKKELEDRQKNFDLLQSRYKDLESAKIQESPYKYAVDGGGQMGNDVEVEVVEIELPMNGGDACTKRRFLRKTIRRRSLSIARSIESRRFGVKTNQNPNSNPQLPTALKN